MPVNSGSSTECCPIILFFHGKYSFLAQEQFRDLLLRSWQENFVVIMKNKIGCWDSLFPETTIRSSRSCPQQKELLFWLILCVSVRGGTVKLLIRQTPFSLCWQPGLAVSVLPFTLLQAAAQGAAAHWELLCSVLKIRAAALSSALVKWNVILGFQRGYNYVALILGKLRPSNQAVSGEGLVTAWVELLISCPKR